MRDSTVDTMPAEQVDLSQFPGDSDKQQAEILRIADRDAFNWGCAQSFCAPVTSDADLELVQQFGR